MSDALFAAALEHVIGIEGDHSDDPADSGGRTKFGITEAVAREHGYTGHMRDLPREEAEEIYRRGWWLGMRLDEVAHTCPLTALELFEAAVNCGIGRAATWLQVVLNALNNRAQRWPDIGEDGAIGRGTLGVLNAAASMTPDCDALLATLLNCQQAAHYMALTRRREKDERFLRGWVSQRVMADLRLIARAR